MTEFSPDEWGKLMANLIWSESKCEDIQAMPHRSSSTARIDRHTSVIIKHSSSGLYTESGSNSLLLLMHRININTESGYHTITTGAGAAVLLFSMSKVLQSVNKAIEKDPDSVSLALIRDLLNHQIAELDTTNSSFISGQSDELMSRAFSAAERVLSDMLKKSIFEWIVNTATIGDTYTLKSVSLLNTTLIYGPCSLENGHKYYVLRNWRAEGDNSFRGIFVVDATSESFVRSSSAEYYSIISEYNQYCSMFTTSEVPISYRPRVSASLKTFIKETTIMMARSDWSFYKIVTQSSYGRIHTNPATIVRFIDTRLNDGTEHRFEFRIDKSSNGYALAFRLRMFKSDNGKVTSEKPPEWSHIIEWSNTIGGMIPKSGDFRKKVEDSITEHVRTAINNHN